MKITGIIQARMGSSRFPSKMSADLFGFPIIDWVIRRSKQSKYITNFFLATSFNKENKFLQQRAKNLDILFYQGSENDVLSRFSEIAKEENSQIIVRICGDNPLICPQQIDRIVELFIKKNPDYAFNHIPALNNNYVDGIGAEVFSIKTLDKILSHSLYKEQKEHVTKYIWDNPDQFEILTLNADKFFRYPNIRLDVDTLQDLNDLKKLIKSKVDIKNKLPENLLVSQVLN